MVKMNLKNTSQDKTIIGTPFTALIGHLTFFRPLLFGIIALLNWPADYADWLQTCHLQSPPPVRNQGCQKRLAFFSQQVQIQTQQKSLNSFSLGILRLQCPYGTGTIIPRMHTLFIDVETIMGA